jgi:hypothetical protein
MNDKAGLDRQIAGGIGLHRRFKPSGAGKPANLSHQFAALIRHEPCVKSSVRLSALPAVEHHTSPTMFNKQFSSTFTVFIFTSLLAFHPVLRALHKGAGRVAGDVYPLRPVLQG